MRVEEELFEIQRADNKRVTLHAESKLVNQELWDVTFEFNPTSTVTDCDFHNALWHCKLSLQVVGLGTVLHEIPLQLIHVKSVLESHYPRLFSKEFPYISLQSYLKAVTFRHSNLVFTIDLPADSWLLCDEECIILQEWLHPDVTNIVSQYLGAIPRLKLYAHKRGYPLC